MFESSCYKEIILQLIQRHNLKRGIKARLAKFLNCQMSFISKVLNQDGHFTQEQILKVAEFFDLSSLETDYLVYSLLFSRSGSKGLNEFYKSKLEAIRKERWNIASRAVEGVEIDREAAKTYYSHWCYAAVYVALGVEGFNTMDALEQRLQISRPLLLKTLSFLGECGLIVERGGRYEIGKRRLHLPKSSELSVQNHVNWRQKAIQHMQSMGLEDNFHYSSVLGVSKDAVIPIKEIFLKSIKSCEKQVEVQGADEMCILNIDLAFL